MLDKKILINEFKKYVDNFDFSIENIDYKYHHSIRVMEFSEKIAISENLNEEEINLATIIGLLHDYGRFEQWTKYQTFSDINSIDHGDLATEILFNQNHIEKFYNNKENYNVIYNAIKYHNKYNFPKNLDQLNITMCKVIRDADKLDIMNILANDGFLKFEYDDKEISEEVKNKFFNQKLIDRKDVKSKNDSIVLKLALLYDYNFAFSYKYTKENDILKKLYNKIKNKNMFEEYFEYMQNFLESK